MTYVIMVQVFQVVIVYSVLYYLIEKFLTVAEAQSSE